MSLINIAGLWTSKTGSKTVLNGRLDSSVSMKIQKQEMQPVAVDSGARLVLFRNEKKQPGSKFPDFHLCLSFDDEEAPQDPFAHAPAPRAAEDDERFDDDSIPF